MFGTASPRLGLPYIATGQAQKEETHSRGINRLDALVQPVVAEIGLSTPPFGPAQGEAYIVGASPTGAWAGQANKLAQWIGTAWVFHTPSAGWAVHDLTTDGVWWFSGAAWALAVPGMIEASTTYDAPSIAAGATTTPLTVSVPGAALGDFAAASFDVSLAGLVCTAYVSAADTVDVLLFNPTAGAINLASATVRVRVALA